MLDVGCGEGTFCHFVGGSAERLPFAAGSFDALTMTMVLHHVSTERALGEAVRVLTPGGRLVILGYGKYGGRRDALHEVRDVVAHRWHSPRHVAEAPTRRDRQCSRTSLSRSRSLQFALRIAFAIMGAATLENPVGSPALRSVIRVPPFGVSSHR